MLSSLGDTYLGPNMNLATQLEVPIFEDLNPVIWFPKMSCTFENQASTIIKILPNLFAPDKRLYDNIGGSK